MAEHDSAGRVGYTPNELALLYDIADRHGVSADALLAMIEEELAFHEMGKRRGLFPRLRQIVNDAVQGEI